MFAFSHKSKRESKRKRKKKKEKCTAQVLGQNSYDQPAFETSTALLCRVGRGRREK
jgi:hypothetical protein